MFCFTAVYEAWGEKKSLNNRLLLDLNRTSPDLIMIDLSLLLSAKVVASKVTTCCTGVVCSSQVTLSENKVWRHTVTW